MTHRRIALVYPPFGPSSLPSLGLSLLAARAREAGHACRTHYWNLEFALEMPGAGRLDRVAAYDMTSQRNWHPLNEWLFTPALYEMADPAMEAQAETALWRLAGAAIDVEELLALRARSPEIVARFAARLAGFDAVGIATTFYQNVPTMALARAIKALSPSTAVIIGGANTDGDMGRGLMQLFPYPDFAFVGETDRGLITLLDTLDQPERHADIPGLVFRRPDGALGQGPAAPAERAMDDLPTPDFDDYCDTWQQLGYGEHRQLVLTLETSRGCWWGERSHCTFCGLNANGMAHRAKSPDRVRDELEEVVARYGPRLLFMTDNILTMSYFDTVLGFLRDRDLGFDMFYEVKSNLGREHVRKLADAGVSCVQPGIESFSSALLKHMGKGVTAAQNVAFLKYAREYGIRLTYNLLIGFPGEDGDAYREAIRQMPMLAHLQPPTSIPLVEFHRFSPYHDNPARFGITLRPAPEYALLYPRASQEELASIAYYFVRADLPDRRPPDYLAALCDAVADWTDRFDDSRPTLSFRAVANGVEITDTRARDGNSRRFLLRGVAAEVYELLDRPQGVPALVAAICGRAGAGSASDEAWLADSFAAWLQGGPMPIMFPREEFLAEPEACLSLLTEAGLIFVDHTPGGRTLYVALAVPETVLPVSREWLRAEL